MSSAAQRLARMPHLPEAICVAGGVAIALAMTNVIASSPILLAAAIALPVLGIASLVMFGFTGSLLVACAVSCFLLMNRIDEVAIIPLEDTALKASYWLVMAAGLALAAMNLLRLMSGVRASSEVRRFSRSFLGLMAGFALVIITGAVLNHFFDRTIAVREWNGELLASISILAPMFFVPLILHAPISRKHLVRTIMIFIALGGLSGLTMAAFGFLPGRLLDALGWATANQGTVGLLRGRMPLGHPNAVAAVIILLLPPAAVLSLIPGSRFFRAAYFHAAIFMFGGVLFSLARSALIVTTAILGITVAYIYFGRGRKTVTTYLLPLFFAVALTGVMVYLFTSFDFSRFWSKGYWEDATVDRRNESLMTSIEVFKDHPLWGVTPDAMYTRLEIRPGWEPPKEDKISPVFYYGPNVTAETPHNMYMTVLAETGVLGAIFFFGMIGLVFKRLWRLRKSPGLSDEQRHALMAFMLGLLGFLLMGAFESLLMVGLRPAFLFWAMAGMALRYAHDIAEAAQADA